MVLRQLVHIRKFSSKVSNIPRVCIIGSGPAAFYTAQQLLKGNKTVTIDMYEKLPAPFGLIRYGVAPDHPEVKNVINTFNQVAKNDRFSYFGNVTVGQDITLKELQDSYSATVLAYGAAVDKRMNIPGENLPGVHSAREFVSWYNGFPGSENFHPNLDCEAVAIVGHGNVALDVARILLAPIEFLKKTDIPEPVIDCLSHSRVTRVHLIGRRGPVQVAFTIKELRELVRLPRTISHFPKDAFHDITKEQIESLPRPRRRLTELLSTTAQSEPADTPHPDSKHWHIHFLRSPKSVLGKDRVSALELTVNQLKGQFGESQEAVPTSSTEELPCGIVLPSIGYRSLKIDPNMPYDDKKGIVPHTLGRAVKSFDDPTVLRGLYCVGWIKRGPVGVILSTMSDAVETGRSILEDLDDLSSEDKPGASHILSLLSSRSVRHVSFEEWAEIDFAEVTKGSKLGKPREKFRTTSEMLSTLFTDVKKHRS